MKEGERKEVDMGEKALDLIAGIIGTAIGVIATDLVREAMKGRAEGTARGEHFRKPKR